MGGRQGAAYRDGIRLDSTDGPVDELRGLDRPLRSVSACRVLEDAPAQTAATGQRDVSFGRSMLASMEGKVLQRMGQVASAAVRGLWRASAPRAARDRERSWTCVRGPLSRKSFCESSPRGEQRVSRVGKKESRFTAGGPKRLSVLTVPWYSVRR